MDPLPSFPLWLSVIKTSRLFYRELGRALVSSPVASICKEFSLSIIKMVCISFFFCSIVILCVCDDVVLPGPLWVVVTLSAEVRKGLSWLADRWHPAAQNNSHQVITQTNSKKKKGGCRDPFSCDYSSGTTGLSNLVKCTIKTQETGYCSLKMRSRCSKHETCGCSITTLMLTLMTFSTSGVFSVFRCQHERQTHVHVRMFTMTVLHSHC